MLLHLIGYKFNREWLTNSIDLVQLACVTDYSGSIDCFYSSISFATSCMM